MTHHNFGLLDLSHFPTTYETSRYVVRTLRPYITHFHIGNAVVKKGCEAYGISTPIRIPGERQRYGAAGRIFQGTEGGRLFQ